MFNEGFWFFYAVGIVESIRNVGLPIALLIGIIAAAIWVVALIEKAPSCYPRRARRVVIICAIIVVIIFFIPSPAAFYAGAGQEIGEHFIESQRGPFVPN